MAAPAVPESVPCSTLFVRNLPYSATKENLDEVFSDIGPVKKSFVVTERGVKEKCRGFGYVTFAQREDAEKATNTTLYLDKRKLYTTYSRKKDPKKSSKGQNETEVEDTELPTTERKRRTEGGEVSSKTGSQTSELAAKGSSTARSKEKRKAEEETTGSKDKRGRLIVRNLAFSCSEERLQKSFTRFGKIEEVHIPRDPKDASKVRGFGFIQFNNVDDATKAMKEMNAKKIMGRPVAVDWALSRDMYLAAAKSTKPEEQSVDEEKSSDEESASNEESGVESSSEIDTSKDDDEDDNNDDGDLEDEEDDSDSNSSEDEGVASNDDGSKKRTQKSSKSEHKVAKPRKISNDVGEGRTLFIRNILFETTEDEIRELFAQFGEITYCKLVVDKATEHSKGTAFVQFTTKEGAEKCLERANKTDEGDEGLILGGRNLLVSLALPRDEASKLREVKKEEQKAVKKDKRNMYLLQEGFIRPGTKAAQGMTDADVAKRTKLEMIKRQKLNNINIFVSPTRLAIHNLPRAVDNKSLKEALLKAAGEKKAKVVESRVMRDMKTLNAEGQGRSLGYAFAEFTKHEHALAALRKMNNNTEYIEGSKRPIVGFSLENRLALETKQRRQERSIAKGRHIQALKKSQENKNAETNAVKKPIPKRKSQKGVAPPVPASKLEHRLQSKGKVTVHVGAKQRWRDRGKALEVKKGQRKERKKHLLGEGGQKKEPAVSKQWNKQPEVSTQQSRRQKKKTAEDFKFDKLVASYKRKLFRKDDAGPNLKKSKWFDES